MSSLGTWLLEEMLHFPKLLYMVQKVFFSSNQILPVEHSGACLCFSIVITQGYKLWQGRNIISSCVLIIKHWAAPQK